MVRREQTSFECTGFNLVGDKPIRRRRHLATPSFGCAMMIVRHGMEVGMNNHG
jgi:hypothetical protein